MSAGQETQPEGVIFYQMSVRYATLNSVQVSGGVRVLLDLPKKTGYVQIISLANEVYASHFVNSMSFLPPTSAAGVAWSAIPWVPEDPSRGTSTQQANRAGEVPVRSLSQNTKVDTAQAVFWDPNDAQRFKTVLDAISTAFSDLLRPPAYTMVYPTLDPRTLDPRTLDPRSLDPNHEVNFSPNQSHHLLPQQQQRQQRHHQQHQHHHQQQQQQQHLQDPYRFPKMNGAPNGFQGPVYPGVQPPSGFVPGVSHSGAAAPGLSQPRLYVQPNNSNSYNHNHSGHSGTSRHMTQMSDQKLSSQPQLSTHRLPGASGSRGSRGSQMYVPGALETEQEMNPPTPHQELENDMPWVYKNPSEHDPYAFKTASHGAVPGEDPYAFMTDRILFTAPACLVFLVNKKEWREIYRGTLKILQRNVGNQQQFSMIIERNEGDICQYHRILHSMDFVRTCLTQFGVTFDTEPKSQRCGTARQPGELGTLKDNWLLSFKSRQTLDQFQRVIEEVLRCLRLLHGPPDDIGESQCCESALCDSCPPPANMNLCTVYERNYCHTW